MTHEVALNGYAAVCTSCGSALYLGTKDSYGTEWIHLTVDESWAALAITAVFTNGGSTEVSAVDGKIQVPPEACAQRTGAVPGRIVFKGTGDGVQRISTDLFYYVADHAPVNGENSITPTADQYAQFVAAVKADADRAEDAAARVEEAAGNIDPDAVKNAVAEYMEENPVEALAIDTTLTKSGQAADAKAVGDALADLEQTQGKDGYTPVRGTDYWTEEDIAEIKAYVDEAILGGAW